MATEPGRAVRLILVGLRTHALELLRSPLEIAAATVLPVIYATVAGLLSKAGDDPGKALPAVVGAGLMGVWSSTLLGSATAIHAERYYGTLEVLVAAPAPLGLVIGPIVLAAVVTGMTAVVVTTLWGGLVLGIPVTVAQPAWAAVSVLAFVAALGAVGAMLAALCVLSRFALVIINALHAPVWLLCGFLMPISVLPVWTRPLSWALPPTWASSALRAALTGTGSSWRPVAVCLLLSLGYLTLGVLGLRWVDWRVRVGASLSLT